MRHPSGILILTLFTLFTIFIAKDGEASPMEIGPVSGLTTVWHPAPDNLSVPTGTQLLFRRAVTSDAEVMWVGAKEISREGQWSIAECHLDYAGRHTVASDYVTVDGQRIKQATAIDVVAIALEDITVSPIEVTVDPVELDFSRINASSFEYFEGDSIAALRRVSESSYRTSIRRRVALRVDVEPAGFGSLMEWRIPGRRPQLGTSQFVRHQHPRREPISVGPVANPSAVFLETYKVEITSHVSDRGDVPDGLPVTFRARTTPRGYEDDVTWLATTKYGRSDKVLGRGPEFTVTFDETRQIDPGFGVPFRWLGVRADSAVFNLDQKGEPFNFEVTGVEINQGIQNLDNEMPLIANRQTIIRVYARETTGQDISGIRARLFLDITWDFPPPPDGGAGGGFGTTLESAPITVRADGGSRLDLDHSFQFEIELPLPLEAVTPGALSVQAEVNWDMKDQEIDDSDNLSGEVMRPLHRAEPLKVHFVPVHLHEPAPDAMTEVDPSGPVFEHRFLDGPKDLTIALTLLRHHPLALSAGGLRFSWQSRPVFPLRHDQGVEWNLRRSADRTAINERLAVIRALNDPATIYYGMVAPAGAAGGFSGWANNDVAWGVMSPATSTSSPWRVSGGLTLVHEVGHRRGLAHMRCRGNEARGGPLDPDYPWPEAMMNPCQLADVSEEGYYGLDVYHAPLGLTDPVVISNDPAVSPPNRGFPMMGYQFPQWISPFEFCKLMPQYGVPCGLIWPPPHAFDYEPVERKNLNAPTSAESKGTQEFLLVSGLLDLEGRSAEFSRFYRMQIGPVEQAGRPRAEGGASSWVLTLEDVDGTVLLSQDVDVQDPQIDDELPDPAETGDAPSESLRFSALNEWVPFPSGVAWIRLSVEGQVVAEREVSASRPVVAFLGAEDGDVPEVLRWSIVDDDSADVASSLSYSADRGQTWLPLTLETPALELALDDELLQSVSTDDGTVRFRVIVTDGVNTGFAFSDDLRIPNVPPRAFIVLAPPEEIPFGTQARFEGLGLDREDGFLEGDALLWTSDRDGLLGSGSSLRRSDLSIGTHVITFVAVDSEGAVGVASFTLEVTAPPQPIP